MDATEMRREALKGSQEGYVFVTGFKGGDVKNIRSRMVWTE